MKIVMSELDVQGRVQFAILQLVATTRRADPMAVAVRCPGTDRRDLLRGIELLVADGYLELPSDITHPVALLAAMRGGLQLTDAGRLRLSAA